VLTGFLSFLHYDEYIIFMLRFVKWYCVRVCVCVCVRIFVLFDVVTSKITLNLSCKFHCDKHLQLLSHSYTAAGIFRSIKKIFLYVSEHK